MDKSIGGSSALYFLREFGITTTKDVLPKIQEKTVSTFVKTKVLTEISISTLGFSVSRTVKLL